LEPASIEITEAPVRTTVFVTHAAPEDNEFALWISSKLAAAGYRVWVDQRRLRGGDDFWDEIDRVLRTHAIKQVVVFTRHVTKPGVKKELAIGDIVRRRLADPKFVIPIRSDGIAFDDAPPELIRTDILNAYPNWHDCLGPLFEAIEDAEVPRDPQPDAEVLRSIINAREHGRRFVVERPEAVLTNWFALTLPQRIRYYQFDGTQAQMKAWLTDCRAPHVSPLRLAASFLDPPAFAMASSFALNTPTAYDVPLTDFISGIDLGPYQERFPALNDVANLLRQHFEAVARHRGLLSVQFANGETGWFFPDGLIENKRVSFISPDGRRIARVLSGKFKALRWHVCLLARPRLTPIPIYRIHANIVLTRDGKTPLPGDKTHERRRRLTKSWWNDVWRDRLLAAVHFLGDSASVIEIPTGNDRFKFATWPITLDFPVSYDTDDPPMPREEDEEGTITTNPELDDPRGELLDDEDDSEGAP
jgi:TIR domain